MIDDALDMIDLFLADTTHQSLVDTGRVRDLLLDVRSSLVSADDAMTEILRDDRG